jgi:hypothetical protein
MDTKIKVGVRIRPLNSKENEEGSRCVIDSDQGRFVQTTKAAARKHNFEFDWAFDSSASTQAIYEATCRPLIDQVFDGFNATFFACKSYKTLKTMYPYIDAPTDPCTAESGQRRGWRVS